MLASTPERHSSERGLLPNGTTSHGVALGVELEQRWREAACKYRNVSVGAANPGSRADGNRKQRGSRALTAISVGRWGIDKVWNIAESSQTAMRCEIC